MSTTGTYTYNPITSVIITDALRVIGVIEEGGTATDIQLADSLPATEMYIKGLTKFGLHLWKTKTQSITLTASCTYVPTIKFTRVTDAVFRDSAGEDTTLIPLTRAEYWNLADKDQDSQPTQFYYDPQINQATSTLYLWPCPNTENYGSGETVELTGTILFEDVGDGSNTLDVPQEWLETIKYGIATRLAPMYGYPVQERNLLNKEYGTLLKESLDFDTEQESIYFTPDKSKTRGN